ncbi:hypothetical protein G9C98_001024, partial [Cotesia typhae]
LEFHVLGVSMGEYLIQTGIDFEMSLCDMFNEPVILGPKGVYETESYTVPIELMPDEFKPNKYLGILELRHEDKELAVVYVYCNVP